MRESNYLTGINVFDNGMRCDADPDDMGLGYLRTLSNITLTQLGTLRSSRGDSLVGDTEAGNGWVQGIGARIKTGGAIEIQKVTGGSVKYLDINNTWQTRVTSQYTQFVDQCIDTLVTSFPDKLTVKTTGSKFADTMVGLNIYNTTTSEIRRITAYVDASTVNVDRPISTTWNSARITVQSDVSMVSFLDQMWTLGSGVGEYLRWNDEDDEDEYDPQLNGRCLAVMGNILGLGGFSPKPNLFIHTTPNTTDFHSLEATCAANADVAGANTVTITTTEFRGRMLGAYIYNPDPAIPLPDRLRRIIKKDASKDDVVTTDGTTDTWDDATVYVIENWASTNSEITAVIGIDDYFAIFDRNTLVLYDPVSGQRKTYVGRGVLSPRAVAISPDGVVFFTNPNGVYMIPQRGVPTKISNPIQNRASREGLFDLVELEEFYRIASGIVEDEYFVSFRDLSSEYQGNELPNVNGVYNFAQNNWTTRNMPASCYIDIINNDGEYVTYYGRSDNRDIYKVNGEDESDTEWFVELWNVTLEKPHEEKVFDIYMRYKSENEWNLKVSREYGEYEQLAKLPAQTNYKTVRIPFRQSANTISLRLEGTGMVDISSILFDVINSTLRGSLK